MGDFPVVDLTLSQMMPRRVALDAAVAYFARRNHMESPSTILEYARAFEAYLTAETPEGNRS